jgi:hypothetical protein
MSEEIKYMQLVTWNKKMILLHGDKLTRTQKLIGLRSNGLHTEWRFTDRYGKISWSATLQDGCGCCRFKAINYTHPYRQSRVYVPVTAEQEAVLFAEACRMADFPEDAIDFTSDKVANCPTPIFYGEDAIKYDKAGVSLSFISKRRIWNPHNKRVWCNEACGLLALKVWPDVFGIGDIGYTKIKQCSIFDGWTYTSKVPDGPKTSILPHDLMPDQTEYLMRHYFKRNRL